MKMKKGYKVVCERPNGQKVSASCGGSVVYYTTAKFAKPREKEGPLAVFRSLRSAERFLVKYGRTDREIWQCYYVPSRGITLFTLIGGYFPGTKKMRHIRHLPTGTVLATGVKLIRKVS